MNKKQTLEYIDALEQRTPYLGPDNSEGYKKLYANDRVLGASLRLKLERDRISKLSKCSKLVLCIHNMFNYVYLNTWIRYRDPKHAKMLNFYKGINDRQ